MEYMCGMTRDRSIDVQEIRVERISSQVRIAIGAYVARRVGARRTMQA